MPIATFNSSVHLVYVVSQLRTLIKIFFAQELCQHSKGVKCCILEMLKIILWSHHLNNRRVLSVLLIVV